MDTTVKVVATRSDGEIFSYRNSDWGVTELSGIDFPPIEIFTEDRGSGNGSIITGKRKGSREIEIVAENKNTLNNDIDRLAALPFHNSNYTYDIEFTYMGQTKIAKDCELQDASCPAKNVHEPLELTVGFLAPEADLFADSDTQTHFVGITPLWHVTRAYTPGGGTLAYGVIQRSIVKPVRYLGSEPAPIVAALTAEGVVDGVIVRVNSTEVTIDIDLVSGDTLIVDAANKTVTLNGERVSESLYNYVDVPALMLQYGDNEVQISAVDEDNLAFDARLTYTGRYGGL